MAPGLRPRRVQLVLSLVAAGLVAACFGSGPSPSPSAPATASPSPDSHLPHPVRIGDVYRILRERELQVIGTNARAGVDPVSIVNATYAGWPLRFSEYTTTQSRIAKVPFKNLDLPRKGDAPFMFAGLNVVVEWGPMKLGLAPPPASPAQLEAATLLGNELNRLIGPIGQRAGTAVSLTPVPKPAAQPPASPSGSPGASPAA